MPRTAERLRFMRVGGITLLGTPADLVPAERDTVRMARLMRATEPNLYQRSFGAFWRDLVWTKDEARAGEVRKAPDWPMFRDMEEDLLTEELLFFDKSRRVMASWFVCAFDVWLMAGGQDERWPTLMRSRRNRQIVLASRKLEDFQGSSWFLSNRVRFIVEEGMRRGCWEAWPEFPTFEWTQTLGVASNGSRINAVPQGKDQCRGPGATFLHFEEVAAWEQAQPSIEAARMTLTGGEGTGGHMCCLSTAQVGTFAADLVLDQIGRRRWS